MPVAAPADRRFKRAQVDPARRRRRRTLWVLAARVAVVALVAGAAGVQVVRAALSADALTVSAITISGNVRLSNGEVLSLLTEMRGRSLVTLDLDGWRDRLLTLPWVEDAALRRVLPGTVAVSVTEREPMAIGRLGAGLYLVDWEGRLIDQFGPNYADLDLPVVDGLAARGARPGEVDPDRAALAVRVLADVRPRAALAGRISQIDVSDVRDAVVILEGDTALVRLGDERFLERIESYLDMAPALRERVPDIDYVDLRFDERVYVRELDQDGATAARGGRGPSGS